jgi:3alpha(or 20beta)-hydroxysteroid dehydrogenase
MGRLDGKVAVISGGARGQGAAEARLFSAEGAAVVVGDLLDDQGRALAAELGDRARYVHLDVRDPASWAGIVQVAEEAFGPVGVLVNNAGISGTNSGVVETSLDDYLAVVAVNQTGTFLGMQAATPSMRRGGSGSIVNISSTAGLMGYAGPFAYCTSKWAIRGMTKSAALELAPEIRVNSVHPGPVDTPMIHPQGVSPADFAKLFTAVVPLGRHADPMEIARVVLFLASDESSFMTGAELAVDGGRTVGDAQPQPLVGVVEESRAAGA